MSSPPGRRGHIDLTLRNMSLSHKPHINISLKGLAGYSDQYIQSFSTLDRIEGTVSIRSKVTTAFEDIEIAMLGCTKTYVDRLATPATVNCARTEATHRFLKLTQPIPDSQIPFELQAGRTYTFSFTFAIPTNLLPRACAHRCDNDQVKEAHLLLPPSFGDPELSGYDGKLLDDLAPEMARVSYWIRAKITKWNNDGSENIIAEASKKLRVKPAYEEQAPLNIDVDDEYCGRQEKTLRKGLMKGKLGRLVMEAAQPKSFKLPATNPGDIIPAVTTMAKVRLRFDPHEADSPPPRLGSLSSKLKVTTFFGSSPRHSFPRRATTFTDMSQGYISETLSLSSLCVASVDWQRHGPAPQTPELVRRESATSTSSVNSGSTDPGPSSSSHATFPYYTASITVPLALPTNKNFVPTFHSCIVSRIYALSLSLSAHGQPLGPALSLRLPVQISCEGSVASVERRRLSERAEEAAAEADSVFEPRSMSIPRLDATQNNEAPPGYDGPPFSTHHGNNSSINTRAGTMISGVMVTAH